MPDFWLEPPDAVPVTQAILAARFTGVSIVDEMPVTRPSQFIVVNRIGGGQVNPKQDRATMLLEFWAESSAVAAQMARAGRAALKNSKGKGFTGVFSYGWSNENGPTDFNDPDIQDRRRCQLVGDLLLSVTEMGT